MSEYSGPIFTLLSLLTAAVIGAVLHAWWQHRLKSMKMRIPSAWPLLVRNMVNTRERRVWHWLVRNFKDYHVMVKMPLTRFAMPQFKAEGQHWFELLGGVYCTFTICSDNGTVFGCVDVPGTRATMSNHALKRSLLSHCNMTYWVLDPDKLPDPKEIRYAFLGTEALQEDEKPKHSEAELTEARARRHAALEQQSDHKRETFTRDASQADSFVVPLDSRSAPLSKHLGPDDWF
jgi:hypothetical protein